MAFHVRDPETDRVVRQLAATNGTSLTRTIHDACQDALDKAQRSAREDDMRARLKAFHERFARYPQDPDVVIDKAFFDDLWEE